MVSSFRRDGLNDDSCHRALDLPKRRISRNDQDEHPPLLDGGLYFCQCSGFSFFVLGCMIFQRVLDIGPWNNRP